MIGHLKIATRRANRQLGALGPVEVANTIELEGFDYRVEIDGVPIHNVGRITLVLPEEIAQVEVVDVEIEETG